MQKHLTNGKHSFGTCLTRIYLTAIHDETFVFCYFQGCRFYVKFRIFLVQDSMHCKTGLYVFEFLFRQVFGYSLFDLEFSFHKEAAKLC